MNLTTFFARTTEPRGIAVMLVLEAFKTPKAHMVAIEGYGISLFAQRDFLIILPCSPTHLIPLRFNSSHEHSGLRALNDVAVCWRLDDQSLARTQENSI